jgi:signal transduction histidine kinase
MRVLLVEDEQPLAGYIAVGLRRHGFAVDIVLDGRTVEAFVRGNTDRTQGEGGAGLGLSIARAIVTAHHGDMSVEARPGGGLVVALRFLPA